MTTEEAKALVLREGLAGENTPEDAAFIMLHFGDDPGRGRVRDLLAALKLVCDDLQGEAAIDKSLAAALWTLGNTANECLYVCEKYRREWPNGTTDDVLELIMAIEGVFYGVQWDGLRKATKD